MRTPQIYLETTLFNYYFDTDRDAHADTVKLFDEIKAGKYEAFTSAYVLRELRDAPTEKRDKMLALIDEYGITTVELSAEAEGLADEYVKQAIIPEKYKTDGLHIAIATINGLDMIISLNFRHIVKKKTMVGTEYINTAHGYRKIDIFSPMEVVDNDTE
ncbi:MAG: hypothetical protein FWH32_08030 [Clostridiales bacterium]|nr:hypothetical protein [Clostridiales bacterium]